MCNISRSALKKTIIEAPDFESLQVTMGDKFFLILIKLSKIKKTGLSFSTYGKLLWNESFKENTAKVTNLSRIRSVTTMPVS